MNQQKSASRTYHGDLVPQDMAQALVLRFKDGDTHAHWVEGHAGDVVIHIQSRRLERNDPSTDVTVHINRTGTGVSVSVSEQKILGVAADLAKTGWRAVRNPRSLLRELDDVARNVRRLTLRQEVWKAVDDYCRSHGSGVGVAPQLQAAICEYCGTPNDLGTGICKACGAPLTSAQPLVCHKCGFLNKSNAKYCANCGASLL